MAKNRETRLGVITSRGIFIYNEESSPAALAAYKAHKDLRGITDNSPTAAAGIDLTIPYHAINQVSWGYKETDNDIEDENCKVMTPEPEKTSMTIENADGFDMSFTLTLGDTSINGKYGDFTFENGVAQAQIPEYGTWKLSGVEAGMSYTISGSRVTIDINSPNRLTGTTPATVILRHMAN